MTFSITARCPVTGMVGVAVSSSSPAVAARCAHVRAGVGAIASQNVTDPRLGPLGLDLLSGGATPEQVMQRFEGTQQHLEWRQLAVVDVQGRTAVRSGERTLGRYGTAVGDGVVCAGNLLADRTIPEWMVARFLVAAGPFPARLLAAMREALDRGGEEGPVRSAGLLVAWHETWPLVDLRVDWTEGDPIAELVKLWQLWEPQMDAYVTRALDPNAAPSYGVPGDR